MVSGGEPEIPGALNDELVRLTPGESMRLLTWNSDVSAARVRMPDGSWRVYHGSGATWHRHIEMEMVVFTHGAGTRIIGDSIERFEAPDAVLI
jgi:hypothetical protein